MVYLEEMYPLTVGYRANVLAESYTPRRDATIKLASRDLGIVPPAPNRITITDFDAETNTPYVVTVLYRTAEGNELRDLTVEEGDSPESRTTHVYPEGSKIFRPLTRADVQTIINNIKTLAADSGSVRYDEAQSLSPIQQQRARDNINVSADVKWGKLSGDISDNAAITNALAAKQDAITSDAKLSADLIADGAANKVFSAADKSKLTGIAAGAEVNVQPDWEATDAQSDAFIANKPFSSIGNGLSVNDGVLSADATEQQQSDWNQQDETKLDHIKNKPFQSIGTGLTVTDGVLSADATEQQQSDWGQVDTTKIDYIKNKPFKTIGEGLSVTDGVLSADAQPQQQSDWGQIDTTKADFIKNKPFASIGDGLSVNDGVLSADAQPQLQSDWTQTDSASADFVKNKPFKTIGDGLTVTETGDLIPNIPLATAQTPGLMYPESNVLTVYVSPDGNDATGDGTQDNPWREIDTAIQRTNDLPNHNITISCAGGQYDGFTTPSEAHNYMIRTLSSVSISGNIKINGSNVVIISNATNADFAVYSPDDIGISINYGGKLAVYHALVKIEAKRYGVYINRDLTTSESESQAFNIISSVIFPHLDVKLTNTTGKAAGVCCNWATHPVMIGNLTVDCASPDGFGIIVDGNYYFQPSVAIIRDLSCNVSDYQLSGGAMLSINGSWVGQSMGATTWGTITGDIHTQQDLIDLIGSSGGMGSEKIVYVSASGSDETGDGTQAHPWREINYAFHHALDDGSTAHTICASIMGRNDTFNEVISLNMMEGHTGRDYVIRMDGQSQIALNGYIETADNLTIRCDNLSQGGYSRFVINMPDGGGLLSGIMLADGAKLSTINDYESSILLVINNQGPAEVRGSPVAGITVHRGSFALGPVATMNACGIVTRIIDEVSRFDGLIAQDTTPPEWGFYVSRPSSVSDHPNVIIGGDISGYANSYEFQDGATSMLSIGGKWVNQS